MMRRKKARACITLYGPGGGRIAQHALAEYPLPESTILALSLQYFDDPEPCFIHRAAVLARAMEALRQAYPEGECIAVHSLPEDLRCFFDTDAVSAFLLEEALP